jgi:hypothetical protein
MKDLDLFKLAASLIFGIAGGGLSVCVQIQLFSFGGVHAERILIEGS